MADHLETVGLRSVIVLGVFLLGITALWPGRQARRAAARCRRKCAHG